MSWDGAACVDRPSLFFKPEPGEENFETWTRDEADGVCATCPIATECLEYAIEHQTVGIWAGTNETQRIRLQARRLAGVA